jgi:hypothetical protein
MARAEGAHKTGMKEKRMSNFLDTSAKFGAMTIPQKGTFIVKFCLFLALFGFAFPLLLSD